MTLQVKVSVPKGQAKAARVGFRDSVGDNNPEQAGTLATVRPGEEAEFTIHSERKLVVEETAAEQEG